MPRSVFGATALQIAGRIGSGLCQLAVLALLARVLDPAEFGRLTFYLAFFLFLDVFTDFGTASAALERGAASARALASAIRAGRAIRARTALLSVAAVLLATLLFEEPSARWVLAASLVFFTRPLELSSVAFQNRIAWRVPVLLRTGSALARLALTLLAWSLGAATFGPYLFAHAAGGALGNVLLHFAARREVETKRDEDARAADRGLWRAALPLAAAAILQQAYFYVDNLFVRAFAGEVELGRYNAAVRLFSFSILVSSYATASALPWLVRRRVEGGIRELGRASLRLALPLFLGACIGVGCVWPFAGALLRAVFGPGFEPAAPALRWLLLAAVLVHAGAGLLTGVLASGRMRWVLAITAAGLAANLALNLWLVPAWGIEGAALATLLTEGAVALFSLGSLVALRAFGRRPR